MTTKYNQHEDQTEINKHMLNIIENATEYQGSWGDKPIAVLTDDATRGIFENMTKHRARPRCFGVSGEVHVWVKSNIRGTVETSKGNSKVFDDFSGYVERNELLDAMTYMRCFESDRDPSIELIQYKEHFLMLLNSANLIGGFRCFVEKEIVFEVFGLK